MARKRTAPERGTITRTEYFRAFWRSAHSQYFDVIGEPDDVSGFRSIRQDRTGGWSGQRVAGGSWEPLPEGWRVEPHPTDPVNARYVFIPGAPIRGNPDLAIVSLGMNPPGRKGKAPAFADMQHVGTAYRGYLIRGTQLHGVHVSKDGYHIATVVDEPHAKAVIDMLHGDATPNVTDNPGEVFGSDVLAIIYQHEDDKAGDVRVHTFGGQREAKWRETRGGRGVEIYDFPSATGVYLSAEGDRRVVMQHRRGLPLVREF